MYLFTCCGGIISEYLHHLSLLWCQRHIVHHYMSHLTFLYAVLFGLLCCFLGLWHCLLYLCLLIKLLYLYIFNLIACHDSCLILHSFWELFCLLLLALLRFLSMTDWRTFIGCLGTWYTWCGLFGARSSCLLFFFWCFRLWLFLLLLVLSVRWLFITHYIPVFIRYHFVAHDVLHHLELILVRFAWTTTWKSFVKVHVL